MNPHSFLRVKHRIFMIPTPLHRVTLLQNQKCLHFEVNSFQKSLQMFSGLGSTFTKPIHIQTVKRLKLQPKILASATNRYTKKQTQVCFLIFVTFKNYIISSSLQVKRWFVNVRRKLTPGISSVRSKSVSYPRSFVLKQWLYNHKTNPYPDVNQTIALIKQTGLSYAQVDAKY